MQFLDYKKLEMAMTDRCGHLRASVRYGPETRDCHDFKDRKIVPLEQVKNM